MSSRWARVLRGSLAASFALFASALFHSATGGGIPSWPAIALSLAFAVPTCTALAGRRMSLWRLSLSVAASQLVFHALFTITTGSARIAGEAGHMAGMGGHLTVSSGTGDGMAAMLPDSPLMWMGHGAAAVVTILALRRGESALRRLLEKAGIRAIRLARSVTPPPAARPAPLVSVSPRVLADLGVLIGSMRHRGPPLAA